MEKNFTGVEKISFLNIKIEYKTKLDKNKKIKR
jgi:hypothetical protein